MSNKALLNKIESLELYAQDLQENAQRLKETAAALKEELSGGSDSSNLNSVLSEEHKSKLLKHRRSVALRSS
ncbi:hypothetical protein [Gaetbulibacter sp. PBL-D1]|uniref:hypothetical protein n=1 Tax=Gaetbulibacter sp. PBL-D1 TaxID=3422594 RepID=UPI003D2E9E38